MLARLREAWRSDLDETRAWACLTTNLLGLPGLGSLMGRRPVAAAGQLALSLGGALVSVGWLWGVYAYWREAGELPPPGPDVLWGLLGLGLFGLGWADKYYRFAADGRLLPLWESPCSATAR